MEHSACQKKIKEIKSKYVFLKENESLCSETVWFRPGKPWGCLK